MGIIRAIGMRRRAALMASAWLSAAAALLAGPADAANFDVNSDASLRSAITSAANGDTITFTSSITLAGDLPAVQTNVTILGNNNTLSGNNPFRGFFVGAFSGSSQVPVTVGLAIANAKAVGGNGMGRGGGVLLRGVWSSCSRITSSAQRIGVWL